MLDRTDRCKPQERSPISLQAKFLKLKLRDDNCLIESGSILKVDVTVVKRNKANLQMVLEVSHVLLRVFQSEGTRKVASQ